MAQSKKHLGVKTGREREITYSDTSPDPDFLCVSIWSSIAAGLTQRPDIGMLVDVDINLMLLVWWLALTCLLLLPTWLMLTDMSHRSALLSTHS
ncbi:hypothetical protein E2C01_037071 [Portunus trituberculatus]|uniref:Uncharacterized protein n=1 Tax=Portunus trituberculatus TaxID=210409 RepID=A0A5B7FG35_PORTR|nr:hypothetical protein [Portunus trituberculatus]